MWLVEALHAIGAEASKATASQPRTSCFRFIVIRYKKEWSQRRKVQHKARIAISAVMSRSEPGAAAPRMLGAPHSLCLRSARMKLCRFLNQNEIRIGLLNDAGTISDLSAAGV